MKTYKEGQEFLDNAKLVLSPMAGITNSPYRLLCQKYYKNALLIGEMVNARSLIENNPKALKLASFSPNEINRSLQIFSAKPDEIAAAVKKIVDENLADHIDLNFGCPVRKIVKQGGGAMIPKDKVLYRQIIRAAKENAGSLPITAKFRLGIDKDIITYIDAGYIAEEEGCAAVTLHARFLKQMYSGYADWSKIKDLKSRLTIKVIGNGDVKTSEDAKRMFEETGADAVAIGRGALGRPWIFYQIASDLGFTNKKIEYPKTFDEIVKLIFEHANLLIDYLEDETLAVKNLRKFLIWYFKGQPVGKQFRSKLVKVKTVKELEKLLAK